MMQRYISKKKGEKKYQYLVIGRDKSYFVKNHSKSNNEYKQDEIIQILDVVIDNIFVYAWYSNGYNLCSATRRFVSTLL
jgi:hypothetical protein